MRGRFGFTLIEIMVTVAIIGILASLSIPAYQNHVIRARVSEGLQLSAVAKHDVTEEIIANEGRLPNKMGGNYKSPSATENVKSIEITPGSGDVTIYFTKKAGGGTMVLHPIVSSTGDISWGCTEGTLDSKYRPSNCRK